MRSGAVGPCIPMAHEQLVIGAARPGVRVLLHHRGFQAGRAGAAIRPDRDPVTGRRDLEAAEATLEIGDPPRRAAGDGHRPDRVVGAEIHGASDDLRVVFVQRRIGGELHRRCARHRQVEPPQVVTTAVGGQIGFALRPDEPAPVLRQRRRADAAEHRHIGDGQRAGGGGGGDAGSGGNGGKREQTRERDPLHEEALQQIVTRETIARLRDCRGVSSGRW